MYSFTAQQRFSALVWLSLFHIAIITSSNYLVQLPVSIFGFTTTWGAFTFPFIFLATDLTVRIFGAPLARRIILSVMVPALVISYFISALFYQGSWQGFASLSSLNLMYRCLTVFASVTAGGWHRRQQCFWAILATRWPSSLLRSIKVAMPSWRSTGSRLRWWTTALNCSFV
jgi:uncharacterized PurR-regulated membrane protein YhhQ (DUF165 family)